MTEALVIERKLLAREPVPTELSMHCKYVCKKILFGWANLEDDQISLEPVTGGLTNVLTKAIIPSEVAEKLGEGVITEALVRHFGSGTDAFFDRSNEEIIFRTFSSNGVGPRLLGKFEGGRIEQFLHADTLRTDDCSKFLVPIGMKVAEIHSKQIEEIPQKPCLFDNLEKWLEAASKVKFDNNPVKASLLSKVNFPALMEEISFLKKILLPLQSPVVFCHNDLLAANLMFNTKTKQLYPIDCEYGSYNFRGYEFGNHFCEWAIDYCCPQHPKFKISSEKYPTYEQREVMLRAYIAKMKQLNREQRHNYHFQQRQPHYYNHHHHHGVTEEEVKQLQIECDHFMMVPHFLWAMWSIVQAGSSQIDFGYMEYALERIDHYFQLKESVIVKYEYNILF